MLCTEAVISLGIPNAGGSSEYSEAVSISLFKNVGYSSFILENQVSYKCYSKMIDFVAYFKNRRIGISVTRLFPYRKMYSREGFPKEGREDASVTLSHLSVSDEEIFRLLRKKLNGMLTAREHVSKCHKFNKCILHVFTPSISIAARALQLFPRLSKDVCNVYLLISVTRDNKVYTNLY